MKIQTEFDRKIKEVYEIIALPYPPKTLQNGGVSEENFETEENSMELKPFKLKSQSYNIQKDELTVHKTSKQLTRFLTECERHRRESEKVTEKDQSYLKYKENVVNFIESLSSKAKVRYNIYMFDTFLQLWQKLFLSLYGRTLNTIAQ